MKANWSIGVLECWSIELKGMSGADTFEDNPRKYQSLMFYITPLLHHSVTPFF